MSTSPAISNLVLSISRSTSAFPPRLTITVQNTHESSPLTVLAWGTPLDPLVFKLGVIEVTPLGSEAPLQLATIMIKRAMPPRPESLITIQPGEKSSQEVVLGAPVVDEELLKGHSTLKVRLEGRWSAVWPCEKEDLDKTKLELLGHGEGALKGEFDSGEVEI
jgi:hypothetical protein